MLKLNIYLLSYYNNYVTVSQLFNKYYTNTDVFIKGEIIFSLDKLKTILIKHTLKRGVIQSL